MESELGATEGPFGRSTPPSTSTFPGIASAAPKIATSSPSLISKLFQGVEPDERNRLEDRRRSVQALLMEIHPPEARLGRRPPKALERDPFIQTLTRIEGPARDHVTRLLRDSIDSPLGFSELKALYQSPQIEEFFQKYVEVREEILRQNPSYIRQHSLEAGIERIDQGDAELEALGRSELEKYRDDLLGRRDTIRFIREDLEAEIADIETEEESRRLAEADYSADLGDGEADEPADDVEAPPSQALVAARQKLAIFNGLIEELEMLEFGADPDLAPSFEELEGIARDFSAYEEEWVWKQLEARLEAVEGLDGDHAKVREFKAALEALRENPDATVQDYQAVLAKAEAAALWTSVEARIDFYSEMHDSAGMTDGIIHLGKQALRLGALIGGGPLAYEAARENSQSDIDGASAYLKMQTRYIAVHRALTEGDGAEARKLFIRLENSQEHASLMAGFQDSQRINQCTVTAAIVTASAATAGVATELIGGAATALGMTRGLSLLKFGSHAAAFTVAERGYTSGVYGRSFFDPQLSSSENARDLAWDMTLNAGMFAFLGRAFHAFEKHLVLPLARTRALAKVGQVEAQLSEELIRAEREALLNQLTTGVPLRLGRFGAELLAFGQWEAIAQNLELNRKNLQEGQGFGLVFPIETLFSLHAWEERFVFLIALKAGGLLAAPLSKPIQERLQRWLAKPNATLLSTPLTDVAPAEPAAEAPRKILDPQDYLASLEGKDPLGSGGGMAAFEFAGDPGLILLLPKGARWEGNKIEFRDAEFYRSFLRETLDHYDAVAHLTYRNRPLAPRIEGLLSDGEGNLAGFLMEKVAGKNLYELIQDGEISPEQVKIVETLLREQLSILHENGLAHGDPEFLNVLVQLGENGEVLDARFIDFTRPRSDKYEPTHGTPQYDLDVFAEEMKYYWKDRPKPTEARESKKIPVIKEASFFLLEESRAMNRHGLLSISQWHDQAEAGDLAAAERLRTMPMEPFENYLRDPSLDRHEQDVSLQLVYLIRYGNLPAFELLLKTARTHSEHLLALAGELASESPVTLILRSMPIEVHLADTASPIRIVRKNAKLALETLAEFGNADAAAALRELKDSKLPVDDQPLLAGKLENGRPVHLYQVDGGHAAIKGLFSWIVVAFAADRLVLHKLSEWVKELPGAEEKIFFRKEGNFDSSFLGKIFQILPEVGGGHDGPQKPKAEDVHQYVEMYENGEEAAGLRGLVELAEQGLPEAVLELVVLKLGPRSGDRGKIQEAMASIRVEGLVERAPEDYSALRSLLELAASDNEAARDAVAAVSLTALREILARAPEEESGFSNLSNDLSDYLLYGNREAEEILFGKHRHKIHPEHLANWEEKILRDGSLNYQNLSPQRLLQLAREGRKDVLFGLLEMANDQASPTTRGLLNLIFFEEAAAIIVERIRWLRNEMGPTVVLEHELQSTPADQVRRVVSFAAQRPDAQRALLELANAGHPEALRALSELPLNGVFEDGQEATLFVAEPPAFGLTAWKFIGQRDGQLTFKKVRMHASEPAATLRLAGIEEPISVLKTGSQYYFLEKNNADPASQKTDLSPFALPFMIFGPGTLLMRGLSWLWKALRPDKSELKSESSTTYESSPAQGWAWNEAGLHYFDYPRSLHLTDEPSAFSEKKYGRWRALGFQVWKGKSILLLQKQRPATEPKDSDATQEYMYFESSEPLRRMMKEDGKIYLVGKEVSLPLDADLYFYAGVSGGSDPKGGEIKRRMAQRLFAGIWRSVPSNSRIPQPTVLREIGGREFLLKTRRLTEAEVDVSYSAILLGHEAVQSDAYRQAAEIRLTFGIFKTGEDYRYLQEHGVPRRSLTFVATREEAQRLGFEYDGAGNLLSQSPEQNWVLKEKGRPGAVRGEWRSAEPKPDPEFLPLQAEYPLFDPSARAGSVVMLGRGPAPAGFKKQFLSIPDPVVRRRHLLLRRRDGGEVEIQGIPPSKDSLDRENRKAFWVEMEDAWLPLPADLPFLLQPGQRFALGQVLRPPGETSQALVFRLSADGNSLLLD